MSWESTENVVCEVILANWFWVSLKSFRVISVACRCSLMPGAKPFFFRKTVTFFSHFHQNGCLGPSHPSRLCLHATGSSAKMGREESPRCGCGWEFLTSAHIIYMHSCSFTAFAVTTSFSEVPVFTLLNLIRECLYLTQQHQSALHSTASPTNRKCS